MLYWVLNTLLLLLLQGNVFKHFLGDLIMHQNIYEIFDFLEVLERGM